MNFFRKRNLKKTVHLARHLVRHALNMREDVAPAPAVAAARDAERALREVGVEPKIVPIRGGTDGARLSYEGLPCPNLCTGGYNFHGRYEFISVQSMEKVTKILDALVTSFVQ